jgi:hypothetical protein
MRSTAISRTGGPAADVDRERILRRLIAILAVLGAAMHVVAAAFGTDTFVLTLFFAGMAVLCLPCAVHVWSHDSRRALRLVGMNAAGMVAVHVVLMTLTGGAAMGHGAHHVPTAGSGHASLAVLTVFECGVAAGAFWAARRRSRPNLDSKHKESPWPT